MCGCKYTPGGLWFGCRYYPERFVLLCHYLLLTNVVSGLQQEVADAAEAARAAAAEAAVAAAAEAETEAEISEPEPETEVITVDEGPSASTWKVTPQCNTSVLLCLAHTILWRSCSWSSVFMCGDCMQYAAPATAGKKRANSEVPMPAKKMIMTQSPVTPPKDTASKPSSSEQFMDGACAMPSQAGVATVKVWFACVCHHVWPD